MVGSLYKPSISSLLLYPAQKDAKYTARGEEWRYDGRYCLLKSWLEDYGPLDGEWVNVKKLERAGTTSEGENLWRSK